MKHWIWPAIAGTTLALAAAALLLGCSTPNGPADNLAPIPADSVLVPCIGCGTGTGGN